MQGYIKLHRQLQNNMLWQDKPFSKGQAWIDLLLCTNYKKNIMTIKNGFTVFVDRGECGYSMIAFADRWGWSRGKVKRFFDLLNNLEMIQQKTVGNHSIIKILNYDNYQNDTTNSTTNSTTNGRQTVQQTDTNNKDKNDKNDKNEKKKEKDLFFNSDFSKIFGMYSENCTNLTPLTFERRNRATIELLNSFLNEIDYDFSYFLDLCKKANSLKKIIDTKIDFRSMLRNHIGIMNGKYETTNGNKRGVNQDALQEFLNGGKVSNG